MRTAKPTTSGVHFPSEVHLKSDAPDAMRRFFRRWKAIASQMPEPMKKKIVLDRDESNQTRSMESESFQSPHGMLFRIEDNFEFTEKMLNGSIGFSMREGITLKRPGRVPSYAAIWDCRGVGWTPTTPNIADAILFYGCNWSKHFEKNESIRRDLEGVFRITIDRPRLLLLGIDASSNKLFLGEDHFNKEIIIRDQIKASDIFILNGMVEAVSKLHRMECAAKREQTRKEYPLELVLRFFDRLENPDIRLS
jgi:hypothetical protein